MFYLPYLNACLSFSIFVFTLIFLILFKLISYPTNLQIKFHVSVQLGKGQNVENHFIESQKKNIKSLKFEKDQNVESQIRLLTFWSVQNIESIFRTSKV